MKDINLYIIEKLIINKDSINKVDTVQKPVEVVINQHSALFTDEEKNLCGELALDLELIPIRIFDSKFTKSRVTLAFDNTADDIEIWKLHDDYFTIQCCSKHYSKLYQYPADYDKSNPKNLTNLDQVFKKINHYLKTHPLFGKK